MRTIDITKVVEYREDNRLEAKRASNGLPSSLWETYSSFANTDGGAILLGADEDKSFTPLEISKYMKASPITIREYLRELVKEGKLGFTGTFRNRSYHIINKD